MNGGVITLCKNFPFVGASGEFVEFDWLGFDATFQTADLVLEVKSYETGTVKAEAMTSTDGSIEDALGATTRASTGRSVTAITSGLLMLVRLKLTAQGATTRAVVSVYLIPKHD